MSQPSAAAGFKMYSGFGLWIPSLLSRCQTFARPLGSCLLVPHLYCVFSELRHKVNHRLDSGSTGSLMQHKHSCVRARKGFDWQVLISSVMRHDAAVYFKVHLFNKSDFLRVHIHGDADCWVSSFLGLFIKLVNKYTIQFMFSLTTTEGN